VADWSVFRPLLVGTWVVLGPYKLGVGLWALYRAIDVGIDVARGRVRSQLIHLPVLVSSMEQYGDFLQPPDR
jgi:hypothetical protein